MSKITKLMTLCRNINIQKYDMRWYIRCGRFVQHNYQSLERTVPIPNIHSMTRHMVRIYLEHKEFCVIGLCSIAVAQQTNNANVYFYSMFSLDNTNESDGPPMIPNMSQIHNRQLMFYTCCFFCIFDSLSVKHRCFTGWQECPIFHSQTSCVKKHYVTRQIQQWM